MRILIAEDDFTSRITLTHVLKKHGHEVTAATTGGEAWQMLQQPDAPNLVILDWMMPEMDGVEVLRQVRACPTEHPPYILMLTTKCEKTDVVTALQAGADDYLTKPFDAGELYARVEVGRRMLEMQAALTGKIAELKQAIDQIKTLRGIVPICSCCKKIRDDQGFWNQVEAYVSRHSEARFSHGLCPGCMQKLYPDLGRDEISQLMTKQPGLKP